MVLAKHTSKNQLTLPKAAVEQVGNADCYDVICEEGRIVLTPARASRCRGSGAQPPGGAGNQRERCG